MMGLLYFNFQFTNNSETFTRFASVCFILPAKHNQTNNDDWFEELLPVNKCARFL